MAATSQTMNVPVNPDLVAEREKATFNTKELTTLIDGTEFATMERHKIENIFSQDPNIPNPLTLLGLSSDEYYKTSVKVSKYVDEKLRKLDPTDLRIVLSPYVRYIHAPSERPFVLHDLLFIPTILRLSTEEQISEWFSSLLENKKVVGTYAQTELGHGSDIKQLETTAIYDENTEEFELNSPTTASTKCWAGGLGRTANHAIVIAQLYTKGKCYGIHMFVVQFRDIDDHSPLPGITIGEVGPKLSLHGTDNGYLHFDHVRIPRKNMLMKYAKVLEDGTYIKPEFERSGYGMMVFIRTGIVCDAALNLAQICTIAVRYNAVRRQGKIENGGEDVKIIDYKTQQYKLFPAVALAYAYYFVFKHIEVLYLQLQASSVDADNQNEYHALAAGMKALSTTTCSNSGEICRRACGGLGYLQASRLPLLCGSLLAACTYEGDNTILQLQTARYLMKSVRFINEKKQIGKTVEYLKRPRDCGQNTCMVEFLKMFESTTANLIKDVFMKINRGINMGESSEIAWQNNTIGLIKCADYHCKVFVIQTLHEFFTKTELSPSLRAVLEKLFQFLATFWILESSGDFIQYGKYPIELIERLQNQVPQFLKDLRGNMVPLVDAFDFSDAALQSVIGSYDGRAYERIYDYWLKLPTNQQQKQLIVNKKSKL